MPPGRGARGASTPLPPGASRKEHPMNLTVAYEPITELLRNAYAEGRQFL